MRVDDPLIVSEASEVTSMSVAVGRPAPAGVEVEAYVRGQPEPEKMTLSAFRGRWAVLFFYPRDFTFVCPTEISAFAAQHREFEQEKAVILGASTDSYYSHKAWFESDPRLKDVRYPVIADTSHRLSEAFGILLGDGTALRATFIIDPEGIVRHIQINDLDVGRNIDETLRILKGLHTGGLCPAGWKPGQPTLTVPAGAAAS